MDIIHRLRIFLSDDENIYLLTIVILVFFAIVLAIHQSYYFAGILVFFFIVFFIRKHFCYKRKVVYESNLKVDIVRQPRDWLTLIISSVALIASTISVGFTWYSYNQLLPLQQANVIFSESGIQTTPNVIFNNSLVDALTPNIINIGKSAATGVNFKIYILGFKPNMSSVEGVFNDSLVQDLQPGETVDFGTFYTNDEPTSNGVKGEYPMEGVEQIALILHLSYTDSLTGQEQNKIFMFQHLSGTNQEVVIVKRDYHVFYSTLLQGISTSSDPYLHQYLLNNP